MGRPKRINRIHGTSTTPAARPTGNLIDAVGRVAALHQLGLSSFSDATINQALFEGERFTAWLLNLGLTLDDLAQDAPRVHGQPIMPRVPVLAFTAERFKTRGDYRTAQKVVNDTSLYLRLHGWDTHLLHGNSSSPAAALRHAIKSMYAEQPHQPRHQAKPFTVADINRLVDTLDENQGDWLPLAVQELKTWVILGYATSMRAGEMVTTLRWSMVDLATPAFHLPGGRVFKHQDKPVSLSIPHNHQGGSCGDRCPVRVLREWEEASADAGIPTDRDSDAFFLPPVLFSDTAQARQWIYGDALFCANPIAHAVALHGDTPKVRNDAARSNWSRMQARWDRLVALAGISPDHQWQGVSSHGLRRGSASTAVRNGVDEITVSQRLRHSSINTTSHYIDPQPSDTTELDFISPDQNDALRDLTTTTASATSMHCQVAHHGEPCGRVLFHRITIDGITLAACKAHTERHRTGVTGDDFTKPIGHRRVLGPTCQVAHHGEPCGRATGASIEIDGVYLDSCWAHRARQQDGKTGDDLTRPINRK